MRPGERDADDGDGEQDGEDEMAERQPPAGEQQHMILPIMPSGPVPMSSWPVYSARDTAFWPNGSRV